MAALTSTRDDIRYGFAVGRVRVLQWKLLTRATFERLVDAPDLAEQRRILSETPYGRYLEHAETAAGIERALEASLGDLYEEFLEEARLPDPVVRFFRVPYDYRNLRSALKARLLGVEGPPLSTLGTVEPEAFSGGGEGLPEELRVLFSRWDEVEEAPGPLEVEAAVDRGMFLALQEEAKRSGVAFLRDLARLRVDLANIRVLLRANKKRLDPAQVYSALLDGGSPKLVELAPEAGRMDADELAHAILDIDVLGPFRVDDLTDLERFDLAASALEAERMASARRVPNGPEPVLAYVLAKEAEAKALRVALIGLLSGLDRDVVRARLQVA